MTGNELIEYICENNLFDKEVEIINSEGEMDSISMTENGDLAVSSCYYL